MRAVDTVKLKIEYWEHEAAICTWQAQAMRDWALGDIAKVYEGLAELAAVQVAKIVEERMAAGSREPGVG